MKPLGYIVIAVIAVVLWLLWNRFGNSRRHRMIKRIDRIKQRKIGTPKTMQDMSLRRKTEEVKGIVYWVTKPLPDSKYIENLLMRAGKTITPKQYVFRCLLAWIGIIAVFGLLKKSIILGFIVGGVLAAWLPLKILRIIIAKKTKAFLILFPAAIDLIVRGLRSGLPVSESLVLVSQEIAEPVGPLFGNVSNTMKLGVSMEKALQETALKLDMTEFNFFTTCIVLQRETGGNLAEILNNLSEVLRNRFMMRMKIKAMSSEARASSYIIGALPFVVIAAVGILSPDYMSVLVTDYRGNICAGVAAGMMSLGLWTMNRMTKFEI